VRATVLTVHRDSSATVRADFFLDADGGFVPGALGYKYRVATDRLTTA
jgi:hypothetical protein